MTPVCTITLACVLLTSLLAPATTENDKAGPPLFDEVTRDVGLEGVESSRVAFADLNGDGRPDAIIGQTRVFLNERGRRFVRSGLDRVLAPDGVREPNVVQVGDVNNDSRPDLYLGRYTDLSNEKFQDDGLRGEIWLGDGKGGFARKKDSGVGKHAETTISDCFLDFERDGNLDLFVGNA